MSTIVWMRTKLRTEIRNYFQSLKIKLQFRLTNYLSINKDKPIKHHLYIVVCNGQKNNFHGEHDGHDCLNFYLICVDE